MLTFLNGQYAQDLSVRDNSLGQQLALDQLEYEADYPERFTLRFPKRVGGGGSGAIHLMHQQTGVSDGEGACLQQTIVLEAGAELLLFDSYHGLDDCAYSNVVETTLVLEPYARLHYYKWQNEGGQAAHTARLVAQQDQHSFLGTYHVISGGQSSEDDWQYHLRGEASVCESFGFYHSQQKQSMRLRSRIHHLSAYTSSQQLYHGMASDQSHACFDATAQVDPQLQAISANQLNHNLLLSEQATIETRPSLSIHSDGVLHCAHGATIGQLDEDALFYLQSRGVHRSSAESLLIRGFADKVFERFPHPKLAERMRGRSVLC